MQEFLTNNTVSCNLMSLTGYRTLVILQALIESPKSIDEINDYLFHNQYIQERFSSDTLRIYINSLRTIGCDIIGANKSNDKKYKLISHPFNYNIPKSQLKAIAKLYKNFYDKVDIKDVITIEKLFQKIALSIKDENTKGFLRGLSRLKGIDQDVLNDLLIHCKNKNQIKFLYNSPKSGEKEIEIIADKLAFKSEKLYLWGNNLTHKEYSFFALDRILKICSIKMLKSNETFPPLKIIYELYNCNENYILESDEKIVETFEDKIIVEAIGNNEFSLIQKVLSKAGSCKVIQPEDFKNKILDKLKLMEKNYENDTKNQ